MPSEIPPDQLKRVQPIVDNLLADLRRRTDRLPIGTPSAVDYEVDPDSLAAQDFGVSE